MGMGMGGAITAVAATTTAGIAAVIVAGDIIIIGGIITIGGDFFFTLRPMSLCFGPGLGGVPSGPSHFRQYVCPLAKYARATGPYA